MTEATWMEADDPDELLVCLESKASERKLRLICCACVRRIWYRLTIGKAGQQAVDLAEAFADKQTTVHTLQAIVPVVDHAIDSALDLKEKNALRSASWCVNEKMDALGVTRSALWSATYGSQETTNVERVAQAQVIRDVFPNPFRQIVLNPDCLPVNVVALAQTAYDQRSMPEGTLSKDRLGVLADALEDAGCTDSQVLSHCRKPGIHVRGCWVVDMILGKE